MKRWYKNQNGFSTLSIAIASLLVLAIAAIVIVLASKSEKLIKIGAVVPLSGASKDAGEKLSDGMLLAVEKINLYGGINGRKIELIIEDSKTNTEEAKASFNKIETDHKPVFYISMLSSISMALSPLADKNKVILIGLVAATPRLTKQNDWTFRYYVTSKGEVETAMLMLKKLQITKLGVLYVDDEYGSSVYELMRQTFETSGGTIKGVPFDMNTTNFQQQISEIKGMPAVYIIAFPIHYLNVIPQLRNIKYEGKIIAANSGAFPAVTRKPESNGMYVASPIIYNPRYLFAKEVKELYETKYNSHFGHFAANGYDCLQLMAGLLESKEISRRGVKNLLEQRLAYSGVFGNLHINPEEQNITFPLHPAQIVNGKLKYLR